jgi:hypothetical protein
VHKNERWIAFIHPRRTNKCEQLARHSEKTPVI